MTAYDQALVLVRVTAISETSSTSPVLRLADTGPLFATSRTVVELALMMVAGTPASCADCSDEPPPSSDRPSIVTDSPPWPTLGVIDSMRPEGTYVKASARVTVEPVLP